jgi:hypothetical protein
MEKSGLSREDFADSDYQDSIAAYNCSLDGDLDNTTIILYAHGHMSRMVTQSQFSALREYGECHNIPILEIDFDQ